MSYRVELTHEAEGFLETLPIKIQKQIVRKLDSLVNNPRPPKCRKIRGSKNSYRIKSGIYRIVYQIYEDKLLVFVIRISHRSEAYRNIAIVLKQRLLIE